MKDSMWVYATERRISRPTTHVVDKTGPNGEKTWQAETATAG
jgi:hypothetical protein